MHDTNTNANTGSDSNTYTYTHYNSEAYTQRQSRTKDSPNAVSQTLRSRRLTQTPYHNRAPRHGNVQRHGDAAPWLQRTGFLVAASLCRGVAKVRTSCPDHTATFAAANRLVRSCSLMSKFTRDYLNSLNNYERVIP